MQINLTEEQVNLLLDKYVFPTLIEKFTQQATYSMNREIKNFINGTLKEMLTKKIEEVFNEKALNEYIITFIKHKFTVSFIDEVIKAFSYNLYKEELYKTVITKKSDIIKRLKEHILLDLGLGSLLN